MQSLPPHRQTHTHTHSLTHTQTSVQQETAPAACTTQDGFCLVDRCNVILFNFFPFHEKDRQTGTRMPARAFSRERNQQAHAVSVEERQSSKQADARDSLSVSQSVSQA
mmetsp:Transcript_26312/g.51715  ORF Transcript_26312/g.51715 Transcript_26312/m.51715 type:complete len:109 (-) Transcript_26312:162-488(-)